MLLHFLNFSCLIRTNLEPVHQMNLPAAVTSGLYPDIGCPRAHSSSSHTLYAYRLSVGWILYMKFLLKLGIFDEELQINSEIECHPSSP